MTSLARWLLISSMTLTTLPLVYASEDLPTPASQADTANHSPNSDALAQNEMRNAGMEINRTKVIGPATADLLGKAQLTVPAGYLFVPALAARQYLEAMGNPEDNSVEGLLIPQDENQDWLMVISYNNEGHIDDEEAKDWDADGMLSSIKSGVEHSNEARTSRGFPALEVSGWIEKPTYDAAQQRLIWSLAAHDQGTPSGPQDLVNYNTYALGREGYFSMNMITDQRTVESLKPTAKTLLGQLHYVDGQRYSDFNPDTDQMAAYGIAALVGGGLAAKKLGLMAIIAAFFAKFFKIIVIALIAGGAGIRKFFGGKS